MKNFSGIIAVVAIVLSATMFLANRDGGQSPEREPQGASELSEAFSREETFRRAAIEQAITELREGRITTDKQAAEWLKSAVESARVKAWTPVAEKDQKVLGEGKWTPEVHAKRLEEMIR